VSTPILLGIVFDFYINNIVIFEKRRLTFESTSDIYFFNFDNKDNII